MLRWPRGGDVGTLRRARSRRGRSIGHSGAHGALSDGRVAERFGPNATPLYLFGAGHVGQSLVLALAPLPFAVTWIDPRPASFPSHVPGNVTCRTGTDPVQVLETATKRARFAGALRPIGLSDDDIARLICPIGLTEIHDKAPAAIAAAVAAQLLIRRDVIAASTSSPEHAAHAPSGASHA